jgi:transposase
MPAPRKYDEETMARAVRMYRDRLAEGDISQLAARQEVGELLGVNQSTLRNWIRREDGGSSTTAAGSEDGESLEAQNARLRRENARLRRANEILKTSSAFFAAAELDRQLGNH